MILRATRRFRFQCTRETMARFVGVYRYTKLKPGSGSPSAATRPRLAALPAQTRNCAHRPRAPRSAGRWPLVSKDKAACSQPPSNEGTGFIRASYALRGWRPRLSLPPASLLCRQFSLSSIFLGVCVHPQWHLGAGDFAADRTATTRRSRLAAFPIVRLAKQDLV